MHKLITTYIANDALGFEPLPNVWLGVTAENQAQADKRIPILLQTPAAVRFVSVEPMLSSINARQWLDGCEWQNKGTRRANIAIRRPGGPFLDWVICGPETGPGARGIAEFEPRARNLRDQCTEAGVPFFLKKNTNGTRLLDGREWNEMPVEAR